MNRRGEAMAADGGNVVGFPASRLAGRRAPDATRPGPGAVAFVDVAELDQERLLAMAQSGRIGALIDARPVSVFGKPRFDHRQTVGRLFALDVPYVEMMMLAIFPQRDRVNGIFEVDKATRRIAEALSRGVTLCVYDEESRKDAFLDETRRLVRLAPGYACELHPRALLSDAPATPAVGWT